MVKLRKMLVLKFFAFLFTFFIIQGIISHLSSKLQGTARKHFKTFNVFRHQYQRKMLKLRKMLILTIHTPRTRNCIHAFKCRPDTHVRFSRKYACAQTCGAICICKWHKSVCTRNQQTRFYFREMFVFYVFI